MTDAQIIELLAEGHILAAVLPAKGGWLSSQEDMAMTMYFEPTASLGALWAIHLGRYRMVFIEAKDIIGISMDRRTPHEDLGEMAHQAGQDPPGAGGGLDRPGQGRAAAQGIG